MFVTRFNRIAFCIGLIGICSLKPLLAQNISVRPILELTWQDIKSERFFGDSVFVFENSQKKPKYGIGLGINYRINDLNSIDLESGFLRTNRNFVAYNTKEYCCIAKGIVYQEITFSEKLRYQRRIFVKNNWQGFTGAGIGINLVKNKLVDDPLVFLDEYYGYQDVFYILNGIPNKKWLVRQTGDISFKISYRNMGIGMFLSTVLNKKRSFSSRYGDQIINIPGKLNQMMIQLDYQL